MKYVVGKAPESDQYKLTTFDWFVDWVYGRTWYMLDIETNVTDYWSTKELITLQFGSDTDQWLLQWSELSAEEKIAMKRILESKHYLKVIHNAMFEGVVLRFHDIIIENVYDTMLAEKVLDGGMHDETQKGYFSLAGLTERYLGQTRDKTEQTTFGDNILTESKVLYALDDVKDLAAIMRMQMPRLTDADADWVAALENEALLSYVEMSYYGMKLNKDKWMENVALAQPLVDAAKTKLDAWLLKEPFFSVAKKLDFISDEDRVEIAWTSPKQRTQLLQVLIPDVPGASIGVLKGYIKKNQAHPYIDILKDFVNRDYTILEQTLLNESRQFLIDEGYLIPANTSTMNWGSPAQVLPIVKAVEPKLKGTSAEDFAKATHPIIKDIEEYRDNLKLISTYGESFIEKYVEPDGQVRSSYNQVVSTGRISSARPNKQNIPAKEHLENRYRHPFEPPEGWSVVSSDMASQELCIIAHLSQDPVWIKALEAGSDLHSTCAELVYGRKWKDGAEDSCAYYAPAKYRVAEFNGQTLTMQYNPAFDANDRTWPRAHMKCKCPKHKTMRDAVKRINFGLAYGMSEFKLSGDMKISLQDAKQLIKDYFTAFPNIKRMLDFLGAFGVKNGYSKSMAPFFRKRWYPFWKFAKAYIPAHLQGIEYNPTLGEIERAAKNQPVQGSGADQIKLAIVLIRWAIYDNGLQDRVHIVEQVHDQNDTVARNDVSDAWAAEMTKQMEVAAKVFIPSGLLKAETNKTAVWSK